MRIPGHGHPISRHHSLTDRRLVGKTSQSRRPQHLETGSTGADNDTRHSYFSMHALAGPQQRTALGNLGDSDHGYLSGATMRGGAIGGKSRHREPSFGTPSLYGSEMVRHRKTPAVLSGSVRHTYHAPFGRTSV